MEITRKELAERLNMSMTTLRRYIKELGESKYIVSAESKTVLYSDKIVADLKKLIREKGGHKPRKHKKPSQRTVKKKNRSIRDKTPDAGKKKTVKQETGNVVILPSKNDIPAGYNEQSVYLKVKTVCDAFAEQNIGLEKACKLVSVTVYEFFNTIRGNKRFMKLWKDAFTWWQTLHGSKLESLLYSSITKTLEKEHKITEVVDFDIVATGIDERGEVIYSELMVSKRVTKTDNIVDAATLNLMKNLIDDIKFINKQNELSEREELQSKSLEEIEAEIKALEKKMK